MGLYKNIRDKLIYGDKRTELAKKNILLSLLFKGVGIATSFVMVPITLDMLDREVYGVWLTVSSILFWFTFFDVGLGSGMRNYLTEALSGNDMAQARRYVSTTFVLLTGIAIIVGVLCCVCVPLLDMNRVFNTYAESQETLMWSMLVALLATLAFFSIRNVGTIYMSMQMPAVNDGLAVTGGVLSLVIVWILSVTSCGNLFTVVAALTITPVVVYAVAAVFTFSKYKELNPSIGCVDLALGHRIVSKGLGFFIIQITSCLVIYGSSNMFVTQYCGPRDVTNYGIAYKLFNLLYVAYSIYITPFWSAYTDAAVSKDYGWMRRTFKKTLAVWGLSVVAGVLLLVISPFFFDKWVGENAHITYKLSGVTLFYICMVNLNSCVTFLLNGLNIIRVQIYTSVIFTALYLVAVLMFGEICNVEGIILLMAVAYLCMSSVHFYQCYLILNNKAKGIWQK